MNSCKRCGIITKYHCILCGQNVCLLSECSIPEVYEEAPGWVEFKNVGYCLRCKVSVDRHAPVICPCSSVPKAPRLLFSGSPFNLINESKSDSDIDVTETSESSENSLVIMKLKTKVSWTKVKLKLKGNLERNRFGKKLTLLTWWI